MSTLSPFNSAPGSDIATSYVSLSLAEIYFEGHKGQALWASLTQEQKENYLMNMSRKFETFRWGGSRGSQTQAMRWPRQGLVTYDGEVIDPGYIPRAIRYAVCEAIYWDLTEGDRMMGDTDIAQVEHMKAGPLDLTLRKNAPTFSPEALRLLNSVGPGVFQGMDQGGKQTMNMVL